jgi:hypothetical protein
MYCIQTPAVWCPPVRIMLCYHALLTSKREGRKFFAPHAKYYLCFCRVRKGRNFFTFTASTTPHRQRVHAHHTLPYVVSSSARLAILRPPLTNKTPSPPSSMSETWVFLASDRKYFTPLHAIPRLYQRGLDLYHSRVVI